MQGIGIDEKEIRESVRVYCRQRPSVEEEEGDDGLFITASGSEVASGIVSTTTEGRVRYFEATSNDEKDFKFHGCFGPESTQQEVYNTAVRPIVRSVLEGYNGTIFAYGQTSAGKTFTMLGDSDRPGIIPASVQELLSFCDNTQLQLSLSYLQIYCEILTDLLSGTQRPLNIREQNGRVFVEGLSKRPINSWEECAAVLAEGASNRVTASTRMNAHSSRSHAALMLYITRKEATSTTNNQPGVTQALVQSTLFLVDLAGSERADTNLNSNYVRMEELKAINLSLSALGNCISALSDGRLHVPYRDSKLTRLLQGSLGGNARTAVLVAVRPGSDPVGETHNTLKFAQRVAKITVNARVTRTEDFEALYNAVLGQLDDKTSLLVEVEMKETKLKEENDSLRKALGDATILQKQMQSQLDTLHDGFQSSLLALKSDQHGHGALGTEVDLPRVIEGITSNWNDKLVAVQEEQQRQLVASREQHQRQLEALLANLSAARQEVTDAGYQLTSEREAHLVTVKEHKRCSDSLLMVEREKAERTAELLADLESKRQDLDRLEATLKESRQQAERAEQLASNLQGRMEQLEQQSTAEQPNMDDYVHREKVQEMEALFMETIEALSERVYMLEKDSGSRATNARSTSTKATTKTDASRQPSRIEPGRIRATKSSSMYGPKRR